MRDEVRVRYLGRDVVQVPGVGVFQHDTAALVPRALAFDLLRSDDWAVVSEGPPALEVRLRVGLYDGPSSGSDPAARGALEPARPEDFGDLPSEGPEPEDAESL